MNWETPTDRHEFLHDTLDELEGLSLSAWVEKRMEEEADWSYLGEEMEITHIIQRL